MDWLGFALAVLLIEITPGPNMAWLVSLTLADGRRAGIAAVAGVALGLSINAAFSSAGLNALLTHVPAIASWAGIAAGAMMFWLAWRGWLESGESSPIAVAHRRPRRDFAAGVGINLLNAKAALFFISVVPEFTSGPQAGLGEILVLGMTSVVIATLIHLALVFGAERLRGFVTSPAANAGFRRSLSVIMALVGCWFIYGALR
ncbi:LysE family translocator [Allopontixanthobacter sediminis]|uniref:LysE family transporter n=1 Tax=Allopontixanthobacter sediminis TaxID=1689985 RepID=A0A845AXC0_9SPHN|nr:LysE family translocator [Allopontixanthobacter sediminis]MXP44163.1 LysE family transporter [Allopontixanthobacter sediminis]